MARLNAIQQGLGDALSKEREDLDRVIGYVNNPQEVVDVLLPLTSLKGIQIGQIEKTTKQSTPAKPESVPETKKEKYKAKDTQINVVQPMFI